MTDLPDPGQPAATSAPLISLCLIVGNVSEYIRRCLSSFAAIADEIVVVRAIGRLEPDDTLAIAAREFGARTFEYRNGPGREGWPHVDDFAAARQMSFDQARGEYCFWCDTDDVLLEPEASAAIVRELAERGGYPVFVMPYEIFGRGVSVPRERMILRGAGKWQYPVHECFNFHTVPVEGVEDQRVVVRHLPHLTKSGSNDRNLRILKSIPREELNTGLKFHLFGELLGTGDVAKALEVAWEVLKAPDLGKAERYDLLLNVFLQSKDPNQKEALLIEAYKTDPERREALICLAGNAMDYGQPERALAYARQAAATPKPEHQEWNSRKAFYGWIMDDTFAQALRVNGRLSDAETVRKAAIARAGGALISLVHATRGRPQQAVQARKKWLDLAECPERIEHLFIFDGDDEESHCLKRMHHLEIPGRGGGCVAAWNLGAVATEGEVIVQMSDDFTPPPRWDTLLLERIGDRSKPAVLAVADGHRTDSLLCMAIVTRRRWLDQNRFLFHPEFTGVFSDNWFTHCAYRDGVVIEARDLVFEHHHPAFKAVPIDETYARQNAPERYVDGQETFERLLEQQAKGILNWAQIHGWFDYRGVYNGVIEAAPNIRTIVEVGSWMGQSMVYLAQGLKRAGWAGRLAAVDTWRGEPEQPAHLEIVAAHGGSLRSTFEANIAAAGVADMVEVIECVSWDAAARFEDASVDFCFIDAAHDYESVKRDIAAWLPKIAPGGVLAGHDYPWHEVARAVGEAFPAEEIQTSGRCWMVTIPPK